MKCSHGNSDYINVLLHYLLSTFHSYLKKKKHITHINVNILGGPKVDIQ